MKFLKKSVIFILLIFFSSQSVLASALYAPVAMSDQFRIARNMEFMYLNKPSDYFSYLLGDKLDPISFYRAYRYFNGFSLSKNQSALILKMFAENGNYRAPNPSQYKILKEYTKSWTPYYEGSTDGYTDYGREYYDKVSVKNWLTWVDTRNKISKNKIDPQLYYSGVFDDEQNCPFGAYDRAIQTLGERKNQLNSSELEAFILNQDRIFSELCLQKYNNSYNPAPFIDRTYFSPICGPQISETRVIQEDRSKLSLWSKIKKVFGFNTDKNIRSSKEEPKVEPIFSTLAQDSSKQFMEDVEYQKAIYLLYRGRFDDACYQKEAQDAFSKILENKNHSYYALASTGLVRSMVRQLFIEEKSLSPDDLKNRSESILALINKNLSDQGFKTYREAFLVDKERILSSYYSESEFIKTSKELIKQNPSDLVHNLAIVNEQIKLLQTGNHDISNLSDFPKFVYWWNKDKTTTDDVNKIIAEYNKSTRKNLWLVLLTKKLSELPYDGNYLKYASLAAEIPSSSLLFYPLRYYGNKIIYKNNPNLAHSNIKSLLSNPGINDIASNYFSDLITSNTKDINIAIENMGRKVSFFSSWQGENNVDGYVRIGRDLDEKTLYQYGYDGYKFRKVENPDDELMITFINFGLPIDKLYSNQILRNKFAGQILTRAFVLGRKDIYLPLAKTFSDRNITLAVDAKSETSQKFLMTYAILKDHTLQREDLYGLNIHNSNFNFGNNLRDWIPGCIYCHDGNNELYGEYGFPGEWNNWQENDKTKEYNARFLSSEEVSTNTKEKEQLFFTPIIKLFAQNIISYAKANPKDARIPEAIYYLVYFNRYNHYWDYDYDKNTYENDDLANQDHDWAVKVFDMLPKYEKSPWAQKAWHYAPYDPSTR